MKGTFKIATFFGIPVLIHWSFVLVLAWILGSAYSNGLDGNGLLWYTLLFISVFASVVMHEYGHALTARKYGVETRDIILLPIGGVARLERLPENPMEEFWVAVAGPLVNIGLAAVLSIYFLFVSFDEIFLTLEILDFERRSPIGVMSLFIPAVIIGNLVLAIFNLIPAFPMDGGRILRALLSLKMERAQATRIASIIGQVLALGFVVVSIYPFQDPILAILGLFIFFVARQENSALQQEVRFSNLFVDEIYHRQFTRLEPHDTIQTVVSVVDITKEQNFVVINEQEQVIGVLHHEFLQEAIQQQELSAPVMLYMSQHYRTISPNMSIKSALEIFQQEGYSILPVIEEGRLVGVLDQMHLVQFVQNLASKKQKRSGFTMKR
ncbi:MAG: site-2 protease family protein [Bacteroidota bacterium]